MGVTGPSGAGFTPAYGILYVPSNVGSSSTFALAEFQNSGLSYGITIDTTTTYSATILTNGIYRVDLNGYTYNGAGTGSYTYGFNVYQNLSLIAGIESSTASGADAQGSFAITWITSANVNDVFTVQLGSTVSNPHSEFEIYFTIVRIA
jgi:hypothetical protein